MTFYRSNTCVQDETSNSWRQQQDKERIVAIYFSSKWGVFSISFQALCAEMEHIQKMSFILNSDDTTTITV